jgi:hypothetical protein
LSPFTWKCKLNASTAFMWTVLSIFQYIMHQKQVPHWKVHGCLETRLRFWI